VLRTLDETFRSNVSHYRSFLKRRSRVQISRFSPIDIDDDVQSWNSDEYEAGYQARQEGATASFTATRSWRAGWADADMDQLGRNRIQ
jgi:hypothetical protein